MKKLPFLIWGLLLSFFSTAIAQELDTIRYNQYGVAVDRKELRSEARNNILFLNQNIRTISFGLTTVCKWMLLRFLALRAITTR